MSVRVAHPHTASVDEFRARLEARAHDEFDCDLDTFMEKANRGELEDHPGAEALAMEADLLDDERWAVSTPEEQPVSTQVRALAARLAEDLAEQVRRRRPTRRLYR